MIFVSMSLWAVSNQNVCNLSNVAVTSKITVIYMKHFWYRNKHIPILVSNSRDVSFQAIAWIQAFIKSKFPHFYLLLARFGGF